MILFPAVVIDETAVSDDVTLNIGEPGDGHGEGENAAVLLHGIGDNIVRPFQHRLPQSGDEHIVPQGKDRGVLHQEGDDAPVDAVGAVALGGVLAG